MPTKGQYNQTGQMQDYPQLPAVWKAALAVNPGDFVYRDGADGYDKSVALYPWNTDLATTAGVLNALLRGVSMAKRVAGQTTDGGVADGNIIVGGEFCMDCTALGSVATPGLLVSFEDSGSSTIHPQKVKITATIGAAIGRVTRDAAIGATSIYFELLVPLRVGGPTAAA